MKVSKIFGCVLGLHLCVIAALLVQPGCQTKQPPTRTYTQEGTMGSSAVGAGGTSVDLLEASADSVQSLDAAFNAGFGAENQFGELQSVEPIAPLPSGGPSGGQTVSVNGPSFETYTVERGDNLWTIAKRNNVSLNELYAANGLNKDSILRIGQQIQIPVEGSTAKVNAMTADTYQPTSFNQGSTTYTVQGGDTLSRIAKLYDTSVGAIKAANEKTSDMIRIGEELMIPVSGSTAGSSVTTNLASEGAPVAGGRTHKVKAGEYPVTIARQYGMTTDELLSLNGITDPRKLQVGQILEVSGSGPAVNVDARIETVEAPAIPTPATPAPPAPIPVEVDTANRVASEITVVEADPIVGAEASEIRIDEQFEGAPEIEIIRLEE
ncbi:MAG: LysM peptidoglycan-binding domain-containing protein [Opitutales bacterium]